MNTPNSPERIYLSRIEQQQSGYAAGRIISLEKNRLYLSDISGQYPFYISSSPGVKEGDIAGIHFTFKNGTAEAEKIILLSEITENPVNIQNSPYFRLHKKDRQLFNTLKRKQHFFQETRLFFQNKNFLELNTPTLVESPGIETYIEPFETVYRDHFDKKTGYYLPTSPEFALKEALSSGLECIFEIAKVFRNQGEVSHIHRPEFYMLEWYRAYENYYRIMDDCEKLLKSLSLQVYGKTVLSCYGNTVDLSNVKRIQLNSLFLENGLDLDIYSTNENKFIKDMRDLLGTNDPSLTKEDLFFKFFLNHIEPDLGFKQPVIVYDYPLEMTALSAPCKNNPLYGERFELYICGIELANAYGELTDPVEQEKRFETVIHKRNDLDKTPLKIPSRFINALRYGLPPCAGIALGLERLFMLMENIENINDTSLFPIK